MQKGMSCEDGCKLFKDDIEGNNGRYGYICGVAPPIL